MSAETLEKFEVRAMLDGVWVATKEPFDDRRTAMLFVHRMCDEGFRVQFREPENPQWIDL